MTIKQIHINSEVGEKQLRRVTYNGREHIVVSSKTLPFGVVMNGGLYTREQIERHYEKLDNTLAPLGHPEVNGEFISAHSPEGLNLGFIGAWNRNPRIEGNRVALEKWIDVEKAKESAGGRELIDRIEQIEAGSGEPIHTSIAVYLRELPAPPDAEYKWIADIDSVDHDAILLHQTGAATPEQGVGMMVNAEDAVPSNLSSDLLGGNSYRNKEYMLVSAAQERFQNSWVVDFSDTQAVVVVNEQYLLYDYTITDGKVVYSDSSIPVERRESWVKRAFNYLFNSQARPDVNSTEGNQMPITDQEKAEIKTEIVEAVADQIKEALAPITANMQQLSDTIKANQSAAEADKRQAVMDHFGMSEEEAKHLTGNALDVMFKKCGSAAPVAKGNGAQGEQPNFEIDV